MKSLEAHRFPGLYSFSDTRDRCLIQASIKVARTHSNHLLAAVTQALTHLLVDIDKDLMVVEQEKTIGRVIDEAAKADLACAQLCRERSHEQRRHQERRYPHNIIRVINAEFKQLWYEEVIQAGYGDDCKNDRNPKVAQQRNQRDQNQVDKRRPTDAKANPKTN